MSPAREAWSQATRNVKLNSVKQNDVKRGRVERNHVDVEGPQRNAAGAQGSGTSVRRAVTYRVGVAVRAYAGKLRVHELAADVAVEAVRIGRDFRGPGAFHRADQLARATLSISSNIAEACGRSTVPEFRRFLVYARGSAQEALTQVRMARRLESRCAAALQAGERKLIVTLKMIGRLLEHPPPDR